MTTMCKEKELNEKKRKDKVRFVTLLVRVMRNFYKKTRVRNT